MNMKKLMEINEVENFKSVQLVFENCEIAEFNRNDIDELDIGKDYILDTTNESVYNGHFLDYAYIRIKNSALSKITNFNSIIKDRLKIKDITWLGITYDDGKTIDYQLIYDESIEYNSTNNYQKNKDNINKNYLEIEITDMFLNEYISCR